MGFFKDKETTVCPTCGKNLVVDKSTGVCVFCGTVLDVKVNQKYKEEISKQQTIEAALSKINLDNPLLYLSDYGDLRLYLDRNTNIVYIGRVSNYTTMLLANMSPFLSCAGNPVCLDWEHQVFIDVVTKLPISEKANGAQDTLIKSDSFT